MSYRSRLVGVVATLCFLSAGVAGCTSTSSKSTSTGSTSTSTGSTSTSTGSTSTSTGTTSVETATASAGADVIKIAVITPNVPGDAFWSPVENGAKAAAKELGVNLTYQSAGGDTQKQIQLVQAAINQKVGGIAIAYIDAAVEPILKQAQDAGITVWGLQTPGTRYPQNGLSGFIGQDEMTAGMAAGVGAGGEGCKHVVYVNHYPDAVNTVARGKGVKAGFKGDYTYLTVSNSDMSSAAASLKSELAADPSIDCVITAGSDVGDAFLPVVAATGGKVKIATFDLGPNTLQEIKDGKFMFAVEQEPYAQGFLAVTLLDLALRNQDYVGAGSAVGTGPHLVYAKDVTAALMKLNADGQR